MKPDISETITNETLVLAKRQLPLTIIYSGKRYVLVLTKQDKLLYSLTSTARYRVVFRLPRTSY